MVNKTSVGQNFGDTNLVKNDQNGTLGPENDQNGTFSIRMEQQIGRHGIIICIQMTLKTM